MFDLVHKCTSFVANVIAPGSGSNIDDESSRDSGVDVSAPSISTGSSNVAGSTTTTVSATSFARIDTHASSASGDSQRSAIFQGFEEEFVRPSRWTTSSESSEDYQDRMSTVGEEQQTTSPSRSRNVLSDPRTIQDEKPSSSAASACVPLNRKRSAPAQLFDSPFRKSSKSDSSQTSDKSPTTLRELKVLLSPESCAPDATTPTSRRSTLRKNPSLRTNVLKQRSDRMKSPELQVKDQPDENFELWDDDVFLAEGDEFVLQNVENQNVVSLQPMSVEISPILPIDRFTQGNASFAARKRSLLDTSTPTRRFNSAFVPSDSSTPAGSRFRRNVVCLDSSADDTKHQHQKAAELFTFYSPLAKSTSMNDMSSMDKSQVMHYHLPATSDDKATVERCPISAKTLRDQIAEMSAEDFSKKYILIDARYPYEYKGGHIKHAVNSHDPDLIEEVFYNPKTFEEMRTRIPIFYCEYSQARGPRMVQALRRVDRDRNLKHYPYLDYPELYLLYGGYKGFYTEFKKQGFCVPDRYVRMNSKAHKTELKKYVSHMKSHAQGKAKMKKNQLRVRQTEIRKSAPGNNEQQSSLKPATKLTGNNQVDVEFNREIAPSEFMSTSSSRRYHAFDSSPDNSELSSFTQSPHRSSAPIDVPHQPASCLDFSEASDRQDRSDDSEVGPVQLSFSSCL